MAHSLKCQAAKEVGVGWPNREESVVATREVEEGLRALSQKETGTGKPCVPGTA